MKRSWIQSQARNKLINAPGMLKAIQVAKFNPVAEPKDLQLQDFKYHVIIYINPKVEVD